MRSTIDNLIENALRYSAEANRGRRPALLIEVVDTGPAFRPISCHAYSTASSGCRTIRAAADWACRSRRRLVQRGGLRITLRNREDRSGLIARVEPGA